MAEWLKAHAWNACIGESLSRVRIPLSPPTAFAATLSPPVARPENPVILQGFPKRAPHCACQETAGFLSEWPNTLQTSAPWRFGAELKTSVTSACVPIGAAAGLKRRHYPRQAQNKLIGCNPSSHELLPAPGRSERSRGSGARTDRPKAQSMAG